MLFRILRRLIERNRTEDLVEKIDVFYAANKISKEEYDALIGMLKDKEAE